MLPEPPLLLITARALARRDLAQVAVEACAGGCRWISLREKDLPAVEQIALFAHLREATHAFRPRLTLHGPAELARAAGADGVHLSGGGHAGDARALLGPDALVGLSIHTLAEAESADRASLDYITASPVFLTASKPGYGPALGMAGLAAFAAASPVPVIALAGIAPANARSCRDAGAAGLAVMGSVMGAEDPAAEFSALLAAWRGKAPKSESDPDAALHARAKS
ncbi:thiamine phosphate synthase [Xanthobacter oligotrophicus]|uniref:thiamine phosphate synthase n=1 Tax=Xanthobacter oligotrophicus TaxID=2607286 RepID=UPI001E579704|nr:thiamine phosphate synthase [Xanthobacter oligotrophicus]MCG5234746.1 thiamine phosphate synthase [Xanthobacter oligotrophicus]